MWKNTGICTFQGGIKGKGCQFNHDPEWQGKIDQSEIDPSKLARMLPKNK